MKTQRGDVESFLILLMFIGLIGIIPFMIYLESVACHSKWEHSGMKTDWGPIKGCLVKLPDGRWLPEERIREIDIKSKS